MAQAGVGSVPGLGAPLPHALTLSNFCFSGPAPHSLGRG